MKKKPILVLDFDGVLHSYTSGWVDAKTISDPPVEGAQQFIDDATQHFNVNILSSRSGYEGGIDAMKEWMIKWGFDISEISFPLEKPAAFLTIDDRAYCFKGMFPDPKMLLLFTPWNKKVT